MLTLTETKLHLRVDHTDEDALIAALIDTATAALLLVGELYEHRERQGERQLYKNATFDALLAPYRVFA